MNDTFVNLNKKPRKPRNSLSVKVISFILILIIDLILGATFGLIALGFGYSMEAALYIFMTSAIIILAYQTLAKVISLIVSFTAALVGLSIALYLSLKR